MLPIEDPLTSVSDKCDFLIAEGFMTDAQRIDLFDQLTTLENAMPQLEASNPGEFVGVANGKFYFGESLVEAESAAMAAQPGRMIALAGIAPATFRFDFPASGG